MVLPPIAIFAALVSIEATLSLLEKSTTSLLDNLGYMNLSLAIFAGIASVVAAVVENRLVKHTRGYITRFLSITKVNVIRSTPPHKKRGEILEKTPNT